MSRQMFFDCPQCGHIGKLSETVEHPTRPMPTDVGFCPKCDADVEYVLDEKQVRVVLADYQEDVDVALQQIMERTP